MKQVSLQELKRHLSKLVEEAAQGEVILISRYRRPVAKLGPAKVQGLHIGKNFGSWKTRPPLFPDDRIARLALKYLEDDRNGEDERES